MIPAVISRLIIVVIGALYPAYESYKTIRTRNIQRYVRWILYWIVYSLFICAETFADIFVSWLPFYYELKIVFVVWLVLPFTNGATILFRHLIRPQFSKWENVADRILATLAAESLSYVLVFVTTSLHFMVDFFVETALMTHSKVVDYFDRSKTGEPEAVVTVTMDQDYTGVRHELEVDDSTPTELRTNAAPGETQEVATSANDQEYTDLRLEIEIRCQSSPTELQKNSVTHETPVVAISRIDQEYADFEHGSEVLLHSSPTELGKTGAVLPRETQQVVMSTSDCDCSDVKVELRSTPRRNGAAGEYDLIDIKSEPECELSGLRKRKAAGRRTKKMDVDEAGRFAIESEQLNNEARIRRTTRAKNYVY